MRILDKSPPETYEDEVMGQVIRQPDVTRRQGTVLSHWHVPCIYQGEAGLLIMTLHREHDHSPGKRTPRHLASPDESEDLRRKHEDIRHHLAATESEPKLPHRAIPQPPLAKHHPHTQPAEFALDTDHGTHTDRPRPGKLAKKEKFRM